MKIKFTRGNKANNQNNIPNITGTDHDNETDVMNDQGSKRCRTEFETEDGEIPNDTHGTHYWQ